MKEEIELAQRAKCHWLGEGDKYTKVFYIRTQARYENNCIKTIE